MLIAVIHAFVSIFAVINPIGNLPIFVGLMERHTISEQRKTARKAVGIAFLILMIFLVLGQTIFHVFGITVAAFRVAGGILLFGIAYRLLNSTVAQMTSSQALNGEQEVEKEDLSVTPLGTPLLAGPGTIATVMALAAGPDVIASSMAVFIGFTLVLGITYLIFYYASKISNRIGQTEISVISRLMGLLLAVIAVQMAAEGFDQLFPGWIH
ncbi:MarC family protein [Sulfoacidibacillus thermotolerans]|uniref:UPF0056 membrane protein n=1 Tax=Sulfoacidibacillus thermotolerans TaxID=1765684 RepID=A0A2U3D672_SULT2|nr:NAAT family transporter [Sulfoacidibacillus thermotolerans]PWI56774.1 hypothetical protein BM613_11870 [Sulfoacidibacillus thermotolerans]